jgi:hypothetical protein
MTNINITLRREHYDELVSLLDGCEDALELREDVYAAIHEFRTAVKRTDVVEQLEAVIRYLEQTYDVDWSQEAIPWATRYEREVYSGE